jgi:hypothetical protein
MRRTTVGRAVVATAAMAFTSWLGSSPATAATQADGGVLKSGVPEAGAVTTSGGVEYTFSGTGGTHVTVAITHARTSGCLQLSASEPDEPWGPVDFDTTTPDTYLDFVLPFTGTVTAVVVGCNNDGATGTFTITYAKDITWALSSGVSGHPKLKVAGQDAVYTFKGKGGSHVTLAVTEATNSDCLQLSASEPDEPWGPVDFDTTTPDTYLDFVLPFTGTVTAVVAGCNNDGATGTFTITYAKDVTGILHPGVTKNVDLQFAGQDAVYTFSGVEGEQDTIVITDASTSGCLELSASEPDEPWGPVEFDTSNPDATLAFTPPYSDTVTAVVTGCTNDGATGTFSIAYSSAGG